MKIGVITLPLQTNYGGILQAYALQTVLGRMGHEVTILEEKHKPYQLPRWKKTLVYGKRILLNLTDKHTPVLLEEKIAKERDIVSQHTRKFIHQYIKYRIVDDFSEIKENDYDAYVVGSDQVWRPKYNSRLEHSYLDFTKGWDVKRIAYAASFGTDEWEYSPDRTERCGEWLRQFDAVSVRERSGVSLCKEHFGVDATHVLDPTLMLCREDYIRLIETAGTPMSKGTLLCYVLDETKEKAKLISKVASEKELTPFRVNSRVEDVRAPLANRIQPPVEQWLRGFYDAEFVITDSFHACVFSIIFGKPFIVLKNAQRGNSRFDSLLSMLGLEDRSVEGGENNNYKLHDINYQVVTKNLIDQRQCSMIFLKNVI